MRLKLTHHEAERILAQAKKQTKQPIVEVKKDVEIHYRQAQGLPSYELVWYDDAQAVYILNELKYNKKAKVIVNLSSKGN